MPRKKINERTRLYADLAANRLRPLIDAIVRLELEVQLKMIDDPELTPEIEGLSESAVDRLTGEALQKVWNKAQRLWLDNYPVSLDEGEIRDQIEQLS